MKCQHCGYPVQLCPACGKYAEAPAKSEAAMSTSMKAAEILYNHGHQHGWNGFAKTWDEFKTDNIGLDEFLAIVDQVRGVPAQRPSDKDIKRQFAEFLTDLAELTVEDRAAEALRAAREYIAEDNNPKSNRVLQMIRIALDDLPAEIVPISDQEIGAYKGPITVDAGLLHALWCYGTLHPVKNVVYGYGTHEKCLKEADNLLAERAMAIANERASSPSPAGKATLQQIAAEARRYASHYPRSSDGQNTFVMFAEWVEKLEPLSQPVTEKRYEDRITILDSDFESLMADRRELERFRNLDIMHEAAQKLLAAERDALLDQVEELKTCLHDFVFKEAVCDQTIERAKRLLTSTDLPSGGDK